MPFTMLQFVPGILRMQLTLWYALRFQYVQIYDPGMLLALLCSCNPFCWRVFIRIARLFYL